MSGHRDRPSAPAALEIHEIDEPLVRYKLAVVRGEPPHVYPIGRYRRRSYEHLEPTRAVCPHTGHRPPAHECSCGFHAVDRVEVLEDVTTVLADSVVLTVELGGTVIEHERGVRAEQQSVLAVGFPSRCSWCGRHATAVVPGRLWRSACTTCAERHERRHRSAHRTLSRAGATAALGVDVGFVDLPEERRHLRRWGTLRAVATWWMSLAVSALALWHGLSVAAVAISGGGVAASFALTVATVRSRSSRPHLDWFALQCACISVAALSLRFLG